MSFGFVCYYVSQMICLGRLTLVSKGFHYKDQIEELFVLMVYCSIVNFVINFTFLTVTYFSKAGCSLFVLKVPLNPNQSILCVYHQ